jgi:hypothetical protein
MSERFESDLETLKERRNGASATIYVLGNSKERAERAWSGAEEPVIGSEIDF